MKRHSHAGSHDASPVAASATAAARSIAAHIERRGPITFAEFMERALYAPSHGYYCGVRSPWGATGDYITAPQVGAGFGRAVARLASEADALLGTPAPLTLVEVGSGDGTLLADVADSLRRLHPGVYERTRLVSVERSRARWSAQRQRLTPHAGHVTWVSRLEELADASVVGGVWSNELLDALPVHRIVGSGGGFEEIYVDVAGGDFVERRGPPSSDRLAAYLELNRIELAAGQVAEICLAAGDWVEAVARTLGRGFLLTVDYGAPSELLYAADNRLGSLVCQRRFQIDGDPYRHVGEQDITAHVDFGNLVRRGERRGLRNVGLCSLAAFLVGFGAAEGQPIPGRLDGEPLRVHLGLRHLLFSEIGTAHRALLQVKGVEPTRMPFGRARLQ